ncbi:sulfotransferase [Wukongibacter sp. M2B1]|uniref:sulfotransferase n=1 Tax=Wukongibacter sp. M2B1 TaxID=3088895 RepID=UPI003D7BDDB3
MDLIISAVSQRTGSTLLQRIFNKRKNTLIWGEHGGVLKVYLNIYETTSYFSLVSKQERNNYFEKGEDPNQWIANMTPEDKYVKAAVVNSLRTFLDSLYMQYRDSHDIIGFKEVHYGRELELLRDCYPFANIILLVRNPIDIWKSLPHKKNNLWISLEELIKEWNEKTSLYLEYQKKYNNFYLVRYEDIVRKKTSTIELISKLGKLSLGDIDEVLECKLYSTSKEIPQQDREMIVKGCSESMKKLGYL